MSQLAEHRRVLEEARERLLLDDTYEHRIAQMQASDRYKKLLEKEPDLNVVSEGEAYLKMVNQELGEMYYEDQLMANLED